VRPAAALRDSVSCLPTEIPSLLVNKPSSSSSSSSSSSAKACCAYRPTFIRCLSINPPPPPPPPPPPSSSSSSPTTVKGGFIQHMTWFSPQRPRLGSRSLVLLKFAVHTQHGCARTQRHARTHARTHAHTQLNHNIYMYVWRSLASAVHVVNRIGRDAAGILLQMAHLEPTRAHKR